MNGYKELLMFIGKEKNVKDLSKLDMPNISDELTKLKKAGLISGWGIYSNWAGINRTHGISLTDLGIQRLTELEKESSIIVNNYGHFSGNVGTNNGTINSNNLNSIEQFFDKLIEEREKGNIHHSQKIIEELIIHKQNNDNISLISTLTKIIGVVGDSGSIIQACIALIQFLTL